jgi:SM-20-related protein
MQQANTHQVENLNFNVIADDLTTKGYAIIEQAFPKDFEQSLSAYAQDLEQVQLKQAAIGREQDETINKSIRRDKIKWLSQQNQIERLWLTEMEQLRQVLNRRLYLGLFSYEAHFAIYQPGDFYKKHVDAFKGQANRILTTVYYLNPQWHPEQGGELVVYNPENHEQELFRVPPKNGTLVLFLSEEFPHEVLVAKKTRYSIAGWFRINNSIGNQIDPPR